MILQALKNMYPKASEKVLRAVMKDLEKCRGKLVAVIGNRHYLNSELLRETADGHTAKEGFLACAQGVLVGDIQNILVDIRGVDLEVAVGTDLALGFLTGGIPEGLGNVGEILTREGAPQTGGSAADQHGGLDGDGARAAHGVIKLMIRSQMRQTAKCRRKSFFDRCIAGISAVTAFVQAVSRCIQHYRNNIFSDRKAQFVQIACFWQNVCFILLSQLFHNGFFHYTLTVRK